MQVSQHGGMRSMPTLSLCRVARAWILVLMMQDLLPFFQRDDELQEVWQKKRSNHQVA